MLDDLLVSHVEDVIGRFSLRRLGLPRDAAGACLFLASELHAHHPGITVEIVAERRSLSLSRRDADIALRMVRLGDNQSVARQVGHLRHAFHASERYLASYGLPTSDDAGHSLTTTLEDQAHLPEARWIENRFPQAQVALRSNSRDVHGDAVRVGLGLGLRSTYRASAIPGLVELAPSSALPVRPVWLGGDEALRYMPPSASSSTASSP